MFSKPAVSLSPRLRISMRSLRSRSPIGMGCCSRGNWLSLYACMLTDGFGKSNEKDLCKLHFITDRPTLGLMIGDWRRTSARAQTISALKLKAIGPDLSPRTACSSSIHIVLQFLERRRNTPGQGSNNPGLLREITRFLKRRCKKRCNQTRC